MNHLNRSLASPFVIAALAAILLGPGCFTPLGPEQGELYSALCASQCAVAHSAIVLACNEKIDAEENPDLYQICLDEALVGKTACLLACAAIRQNEEPEPEIEPSSDPLPKTTHEVSKR